VDAYSVYLRDPSVEVVVLRRVKVAGAVKNPGLYPVDATMTLRDVVTLAGGATADGDGRKIRLTRADETTSTELDLGSRIAESAVRSGDSIDVIQRGWLARNTGLVATAISTAGFVVVTLLTR
jgi:protein involved in polysaccharide export with SLBB domain